MTALRRKKRESISLWRTNSANAKSGLTIYAKVDRNNYNDYSDNDYYGFKVNEITLFKSRTCLVLRSWFTAHSRTQNRVGKVWQLAGETWPTLVLTPGTPLGST